MDIVSPIGDGDDTNTGAAPVALDTHVDAYVSAGDAGAHACVVSDDDADNSGITTVNLSHICVFCQPSWHSSSRGGALFYARNTLDTVVAVTAAVTVVISNDAPRSKALKSHLPSASKSADPPL